MRRFAGQLLLGGAAISVNVGQSSTTLLVRAMQPRRGDPRDPADKFAQNLGDVSPPPPAPRGPPGGSSSSATAAARPVVVEAESKKAPDGPSTLLRWEQRYAFEKHIATHFGKKGEDSFTKLLVNLLLETEIQEEQDQEQQAAPAGPLGARARTGEGAEGEGSDAEEEDGSPRARGAVAVDPVDGLLTNLLFGGPGARRVEAKKLLPRIMTKIAAEFEPEFYAYKDGRDDLFDDAVHGGTAESTLGKKLEDKDVPLIQNARHFVTQRKISTQPEWPLDAHTQGANRVFFVLHGGNAAETSSGKTHHLYISHDQGSTPDQLRLSLQNNEIYPRRTVPPTPLTRANIAVAFRLRHDRKIAPLFLGFARDRIYGTGATQQDSLGSNLKIVDVRAVCRGETVESIKQAVAVQPELMDARMSATLDRPMPAMVVFDGSESNKPSDKNKLLLVLEADALYAMRTCALWAYRNQVMLTRIDARSVEKVPKLGWLQSEANFSDALGETKNLEAYKSLYQFIQKDGAELGKNLVQQFTALQGETIRAAVNRDIDDAVGRYESGTTQPHESFTEDCLQDFLRGSDPRSGQGRPAPGLRSLQRSGSFSLLRRSNTDMIPLQQELVCSHAGLCCSRRKMELCEAEEIGASLQLEQSERLPYDAEMKSLRARATESGNYMAFLSEDVSKLTNTENDMGGDKEFFLKVSELSKRQVGFRKNCAKRKGLRNKAVAVIREIPRPAKLLKQVVKAGSTLVLLAVLFYYCTMATAAVLFALPPAIADGSEWVAVHMVAPLAQATIDYAPWSVLPGWAMPDHLKYFASYGTALFTGVGPFDPTANGDGVFERQEDLLNWTKLFNTPGQYAAETASESMSFLTESMQNLSVGMAAGLQNRSLLEAGKDSIGCLACKAKDFVTSSGGIDGTGLRGFLLGAETRGANAKPEEPGTPEGAATRGDGDVVNMLELEELTLKQQLFVLKDLLVGFPGEVVSVAYRTLQSGVSGVSTMHAKQESLNYVKDQIPHLTATLSALWIFLAVRITAYLGTTLSISFASASDKKKLDTYKFGEQKDRNGEKADDQMLASGSKDEKQKKTFEKNLKEALEKLEKQQMAGVGVADVLLCERPFSVSANGFWSNVADVGAQLRTSKGDELTIRGVPAANKIEGDNEGGTLASVRRTPNYTLTVKPYSGDSPRNTIINEKDFKKLIQQGYLQRLYIKS